MLNLNGGEVNRVTNMKNKEVKEETTLDNEFITYVDTDKKGNPIIPIQELEKNIPFVGVYLNEDYYPDKKTFDIEQKKKLDVSDRTAWKTYLFEKENGSQVRIFPAYKIDKALKGMENHKFKITYIGNKKLEKGHSVKEYEIQFSKKPVSDLPF